MLGYGWIYWLNLYSVHVASSVLLMYRSFVISCCILTEGWGKPRRKRKHITFSPPSFCTQCIYSYLIFFFCLCVLFSNTILRHQTRQHFLHSPSNLLVMHRVNWNSLKIEGHRHFPPPFSMITKKTNQRSFFFEFMSESSLCTKVMLQASLCLA